MANRELEGFLPQMITDHGLSYTAEFLGISTATLGYWLLKLGIVTHGVVVTSGETLEVKRRLGTGGESNE